MAPARERIAQRADALERLLGHRAPRFVRWLPLAGVAVGLAVGGLVWLLVGSELVLLREAWLAICATAGLVAGLLERTRVGRLLLGDGEPAEHDPNLPAEFRHLPGRFDHREDARARRDRF
jgi:hypothetical protein